MVRRLQQAERETLGSFTVRELIERTSEVAAPPATVRNSEPAVRDA
jgi:hypothetical protein